MSREELEAEASSPNTSPARLQELANTYPKLRRLIAMNPTAYPALVQWLADFDDPTINVALAQRSAASNPQATGPRRVSVMGRGDVTPSTTPATAQRPVAPVPVAAAIPPAEQLRPSTQTGELAAVAQPARSNKTLLMVIGVLLAVIVVAVMALLLGGGGEPDPSAATDQADSASDTTSGGEAGTTDTQGDAGDNAQVASEEDGDAAVIYPAPDNALVSDHFVSPSGNIACKLGSEGVSCTINSQAFTDPSMASCGASPTTLTATLESAGLDCSAAQIPGSGATTLAYGDFATYGTFACRSTEPGVACWNMVSGVGFGLSRGGYQTSMTGPVDPNTFPWN